MIKVLFIDDAFLAEQYPVPSNIERKNILTTIKIAQIDLIDLLGKCLYDRLEEGLQAEDLTADEAILYDYCKMYLVFATAKQLLEFVSIERTLSKEIDVDRTIQSADDRLGYMKDRIQRFINKTKALKDITNGVGCYDEDGYNDGDSLSSSSGIYYPDYTTDEDCTTCS
jgi:hypothetical protein